MQRKHLAAMCALLVAFGAFMVLPPAFAEEAYGAETDTAQKGVWRPLNRLRLLLYILKNGEPSTLTGDTVALEGRILVMDLDGDLENVILPGKWVLDGEVITLKDLYDEYMTGSEVTIHTLKVEYAQDTKTVTVHFGYKVTVEGNTAEAVLPFNIKVP
jgi:hypothetical protein